MQQLTDEITMLIHVFGNFRSRNLSPVGERLLAEGCAEQTRITGTTWNALGGWSGRVRSSLHPKFTLIQLTRNTRPIVYFGVIVLLEQEERFLLPAYKADDLYAFASLMGIESLRGYATFAALVNSGLHKKRLPEQIQNEADARRHGLKSQEAYRLYAEGKNSLWVGYGENFAYLFSLTLDRQQTPPAMSVTFLQSGSGTREVKRD